MPKPYSRVEAGTTVQFTWIGSTSPSSLFLAIVTASKTLVDSGPAVQSGGGFWYRFAQIPNSFGLYPVTLMAEWTAVASTHASEVSPFVSRLIFEVIDTTPWAYPGGLP